MLFQQHQISICDLIFHTWNIYIYIVIKLLLWWINLAIEINTIWRINFQNYQFDDLVWPSFISNYFLLSQELSFLTIIIRRLKSLIYHFFLNNYTKPQFIIIFSWHLPSHTVCQLMMPGRKQGWRKMQDSWFQLVMILSYPTLHAFSFL